MIGKEGSVVRRICWVSRMEGGKDDCAGIWRDRKNDNVGKRAEKEREICLFIYI
jgi:hypothetical protein